MSMQRLERSEFWTLPPHRCSPVISPSMGVVYQEDFKKIVASIAERVGRYGDVLNLCTGRLAFSATFCAVAAKGGRSHLLEQIEDDNIEAFLITLPSALIVVDFDLPEAVIERAHYIDIRSVLSENKSDGSAALPSFSIQTSLCAAHFVPPCKGGKPAHVQKSWGDYLDTAENLNFALSLSDWRGLVISSLGNHQLYALEWLVFNVLCSGLSVLDVNPETIPELVRELEDADQAPILVTTPVELRALVNSEIDCELSCIVLLSAGPPDLVKHAHELFSADVIEILGHQSTGTVAYRFPLSSDCWRFLPSSSASHMSSVRPEVGRPDVARPEVDGSEVAGSELAPLEEAAD